MSKQRQIKNFISITQTTDEVANYYMNHFYDVNEAVEAFFNNPLTLPSDMKVKRETPNKEKHIIFKTFEKYAENNVLSGENFTSEIIRYIFHNPSTPFICPAKSPYDSLPEDSVLCIRKGKGAVHSTDICTVKDALAFTRWIIHLF